MVKQRELHSLFKRMLPGLPGFQYKGDLLFLAPISHLLKGVLFERSGLSRMSFYPTALILPLYMPQDYISLLFSKRLLNDGFDNWEYDPREEDRLAAKLIAAISSQGGQYLNKVRGFEQIPERVADLHSNPNDPHVQRVIAYTLVLSDRRAEATAAFEAASQTLSSMTVPWAEEVLREVTEVREIFASDPDEAKRLLLSWERQTLENLKLSEFSQAKFDSLDCSRY